MFFDPSRVMRNIRDRNGTVVWDYMRDHHLWIPKHERPIVAVVDGNDDTSPLVSLQECFSSMDDADPTDLNGCCTTMVLIVVYMCLRYGCRDPQWMVNAIRCGMLGARTVTGTSQDPSLRHAFESFLHKVHEWQIAISNPDIPWDGDGGFLSLMQLWLGNNDPFSRVKNTHERMNGSVSPFPVITCCTTARKISPLPVFVMNSIVHRIPGTLHGCM